MVKALQHGKTTEGAHPITGKEFDVGLSQTGKANSTTAKLWDMIKRRAGCLRTTIAREAWACFLGGDALMQLSFVFGDDGKTSSLGDADVDIVIGVIKLIMKMLRGRQMLVVPVYINGAGCEPHRAVMLVSSSEVVYYDPSSANQADHHQRRGSHIVNVLRSRFDHYLGTTFSSAVQEKMTPVRKVPWRLVTSTATHCACFWW
jgi:hypothetical protein